MISYLCEALARWATAPTDMQRAHAKARKRERVVLWLIGARRWNRTPTVTANAMKHGSNS